MDLACPNLMYRSGICPFLKMQRTIRIMTLEGQLVPEMLTGTAM